MSFKVSSSLMGAVEFRRSQKTRRLSLPATDWNVLVATCGYMGHLPFLGRMHLGSFSVSLITPLLLWPFIHVWGIHVALWATLFSSILGWFVLKNIEKKGTPADHDSSAVVLDEFAGAALATALAAPLVWHLTGATGMLDQCIGLFFIGAMFRVFDLLKPRPASVFDPHWHHPFSVMADDLAAGVWAAFVAPLPFWLTLHLL